MGKMVIRAAAILPGLLVRGMNCAGVGTYDGGAPSQVGSRNPGIAASSGACP